MASQEICDFAGIRGLRCLILDVLVNPPQPVGFILKAVGGSNDSGRRSFFHRHTLGLLSDHEKLDDIFPGDMTTTAGISPLTMPKKRRNIPDNLLKRAQAF